MRRGRWSRRWRLGPALVALALLGGCPTTTHVRRSTGEPQRGVQIDELALGPGDLFEVRVFGEADLSGPYRLSSDGTIDYPLIGQMKLEGLDPHQAAAEIAKRLAEKYLKHPQVSILVKEQISRKITVTGKVQKPGNYPFVSNMTIVEAIAAAGGFTDLAKRTAVRLTRTGSDGMQSTDEIDVKAISNGEQPNVPVRPGDIIEVPERLY